MTSYETMAHNNSQIRALIKRCQNSSFFFIENFCKVKHPSAGKIPFRLFSYQKKNILDFKKNRFTIFKKTRQCGISTLTGAYAIWYSMFYPNKTVLIVSKRDKDAKEFLNKNIKFIYKHLPMEFKQLYGDPEPKLYNEHQIGWPNGSTIMSLPSGKDTLRSYSSSLNIVDEAAFMRDMEDMWAGGWSTISHGGSCIIISTTNGTSNWYYQTWKDSIEHKSDFHPIAIDWWDMDWCITYKDKETGKQIEIKPTKDIRPCVGDEKEIYGPYWSPWLEEQYRQLQKRGEGHKFRQEILAEFVGTGNSVLEAKQLKQLSENIDDSYMLADTVEHEHPVTEEQITINFQKKLKIWKKPIRSTLAIIEHNRIIQPTTSGHNYAMGIDISSGESDDYSAIEIIDCTTKEQVAELNIKVLVPELLLMAHYLALYYNNAFVVPERTGIGISFCQDLYVKYGYSNTYKIKGANGKITSKVGFPTSPTYKPQLNKTLMEMVGKEDGVIIKSIELSGQLNDYTYLGGGRTGVPEGVGHDDLVIAFGLALIGLAESTMSNYTTLIPVNNVKMTNEDNSQRMNTLLQRGGGSTIPPIIITTGQSATRTIENELKDFANSLGGFIMIDSNMEDIKRRSQVIKFNQRRG